MLVEENLLFENATYRGQDLIVARKERLDDGSVCLKHTLLEDWVLLLQEMVFACLVESWGSFRSRITLLTLVGRKC